jgi:hypothetical protein
MPEIRLHRVKAMADWLDTIPPEPSFRQHPSFRFFRDLTPAEMKAVGTEMRRRAAAASAEADALEAETRLPTAHNDDDGGPRAA